ncbi:magnesium transporter [Desulfovibrio mangrovi]|uniref:magnesium transporter n=1 Tax=Desulfovibrio mangrovi TaxID=2976983 RepID=UPI0022482828|nr:magnesium transporter [Desulfovibrio mangrovi]UZP68417.1 magnesium transporter [Desulfovibrio mangrovi]
MTDTPKNTPTEPEVTPDVAPEKLPEGASSVASGGPDDSSDSPSGATVHVVDCRDEVAVLSAEEFAHPADAAEHIQNLTLEKQVCMMRRLTAEDAAEALAEMEERVQTDILQNLDPDVAAKILGEMSPDDAADVLSELDSVHRDKLLEFVEAEDAEEIRTLLSFDEDTAGGIMNTEIIILSDHLTADQAIMHIRREMEDKEIPYYAYIVDEKQRLVGVLSLRDLLLCRPGSILKNELSDQSLISVLFDVDREEVAHTLARYDFMALPVVDYEGRLLGVVTYDDIIDIIHDEASEDMLGMVGAGQDETVDTPWLESVKVRLPWLLVNMFNSAISACVVYMFEGSIASMAILAVLMPIVANQAGNTGQQALAVMIRQLAVEKFDRKKSWVAVLREAKIGLLSGLIIGIVVMLAVFGFTHNLKLAQVMSVALAMDMLLGALAGASIPLILKELGRDPAQASSIFLTTLTDGAGFFIFLGLASLILF